MRFLVALLSVVFLAGCQTGGPVDTAFGYMARGADMYCASPFAIRDEIARRINEQTRIAEVSLKCDEMDDPKPVIGK